MVYVSSAPAFDKLQNQINASTKEAMYGLSKNKKDKDKKNKEFKNQLEKVSDSTKEITGNNFILKGYDPKEF